MVLPAPQGSTTTPLPPLSAAIGVEGRDGVALVLAQLEGLRSRRGLAQPEWQRFAIGVAREILGGKANRDERLLDVAAPRRDQPRVCCVALLQDEGLHALLARHLGDQRRVIGAQHAGRRPSRTSFSRP